MAGGEAERRGTNETGGPSPGVEEEESSEEVDYYVVREDYFGCRAER